MKTIIISELITALENVKADAGDLPIVLSGDQEGNYFGTIHAIESFNYRNGIISMVPWNERIDLDEVEGFIRDENEEG